MDSLMGQFKRNNKKSFKEGNGYDIKNPTHLVHVINALSKFPTVLSKIGSMEKVNDEHLQTEVDKIGKFLNTKQKAVVIKLMKLEHENKGALIGILNTGVINNPNVENEMKTLIKYREQALDYATALGVIDDYIDYLESGVYRGPVTKF